MILSLRIEHVVFIIFGVVFIVFVGCACYNKMRDNRIRSYVV